MPFNPYAPKRPCFSILGNVIGRTIEIPEDQTLWPETLRAAFREAISHHPLQLLSACAIKPIAYHAARRKTRYWVIAAEALSGLACANVETPRARSNKIELWDPLRCGIHAYLNSNVRLYLNYMERYNEQKANFGMQRIALTKEIEDHEGRADKAKSTGRIDALILEHVSAMAFVQLPSFYEELVSVSADPFFCEA